MQPLPKGPLSDPFLTISSSKSSTAEGRKLGFSPGALPCTWPHGLLTSVPETTMEEARPWYATGRWSQLGCKGLSLPRNITPQLVACSLEQ